MSNYYIYFQINRKLNKFLLEEFAGTTVRAASITKQHDAFCTWIDIFKRTVPMMPYVITSELSCIMIGSKTHISRIPLYVKNTPWDNLSICK